MPVAATTVHSSNAVEVAGGSSTSVHTRSTNAGVIFLRRVKSTMSLRNSNDYSRLETGSPTFSKGLAVTQRTYPWKKIGFGLTALVLVIWILGPSENRERVWSGLKKPYDVDYSPLLPPPHKLPETEDSDYIPSTPSSTKSPTSFETDPDRTSTVHCKSKHPSAPRLVTYALMVDAGSTGSRIHVYKFNHCGTSAEYEYEHYQHLKPGLSAYPEDPEAAARSLDPLLDKAMELVPENLHKCTPLAVKATAGLRLLGTEKSAHILDAVKARLASRYSFALQDVVIMEGRDEGVYAWMTANYLLKTLRADTNPKTAVQPGYAVLDLGGGSTQIVFEPSFQDPSASLADGEHRYELKFGGTTHVLYQHSYLGYGLMSARQSVHRLVEFMWGVVHITSHVIEPGAMEEIANPCIARGRRKRVEVVGVDGVTKRNVSMVGADIGSFEACNRVVELVMAKDSICQLKPCSFNGVYQPSLLDTFPTGKVLLLSYFYDRLSPLLGPDTPLTVHTVANLAKRVCDGEASWERFWGQEPEAMKELKKREEYCLDLTFQHALLRLGYEFDDTRALRIEKKVDDTELGWALGAAIAMVGGELKCRD